MLIFDRNYSRGLHEQDRNCYEYICRNVSIQRETGLYNMGNPWGPRDKDVTRIVYVAHVVK